RGEDDAREDKREGATCTPHVAERSSPLDRRPTRRPPPAAPARASLLKGVVSHSWASSARPPSRWRREQQLATRWFPPWFPFSGSRGLPNLPLRSFTQKRRREG